jgi:hypothetical protein
MSHIKAIENNLIWHLMITMFLTYYIFIQGQNLTYFTKKIKIHVFKYQKNKSKIMNHIKYRHLKKSFEHLTNDKFQSPYIGCNPKK